MIVSRTAGCGSIVPEKAQLAARSAGIVDREGGGTERPTLGGGYAPDMAAEDMAR